MKLLDQMVLALALEQARALRNAGHSIEDATMRTCQGSWGPFREAVRGQLVNEDRPECTVGHKRELR